MRSGYIVSVRKSKTMSGAADEVGEKEEYGRRKI